MVVIFLGPFGVLLWECGCTKKRHARESNPHTAQSVAAIYGCASADHDRVPSATWWYLTQLIGLSQSRPSDFDLGGTVCDDIII